MSDNATDKLGEQPHSDAKVEDFLRRDLPHWHLEKGWIRRKYRPHGWKGTLMVVNTVAISPRPPGITPISPPPTPGSKCGL